MQSELNKDTTFFIELPFLPVRCTQTGVKQDRERESKTEQNFPIEAGFTQTAKRNILVVDDELYVQDLLKNILSNEGYLVDLASDGEEALRKIEQRKYDLLLIDIVMPNIDGVELYSLIQQKLPDLELQNKVIFVTGDTFRERTKNFLRQNNYIPKPFTREDFCRKLNELSFQFTK